MDLTADGADELFVLEDIFSIADYQVFMIVDGELVAATVAPPGHPKAGLDPGDVAVLSVGGDEGFGGYLRCEGRPVRTHARRDLERASRRGSRVGRESRCTSRG